MAPDWGAGKAAMTFALSTGGKEHCVRQGCSPASANTRLTTTAINGVRLCVAPVNDYPFLRSNSVRCVISDVLISVNTRCNRCVQQGHSPGTNLTPDAHDRGCRHSGEVRFCLVNKGYQVPALIWHSVCNS